MIPYDLGAVALNDLGTMAMYDLGEARHRASCPDSKAFSPSLDQIPETHTRGGSCSGCGPHSTQVLIAEAPELKCRKHTALHQQPVLSPQEWALQGTEASFQASSPI